MCLPIWLVMSGSLAVSNSFVSTYNDYCLPVWLVASGSSAVYNIFFLAGGIRHSGCLEFICLLLQDFFGSQSGWCFSAVSNSCVSPCGNSFVSLSGWWCLALRLSLIDLWLAVSGALVVSKSLVCSHSNSFVFQSGWYCLVLWRSVFTCRPVVFHLSFRCLPDRFPRCGFPDVVSQLPQGF